MKVIKAAVVFFAVFAFALSGLALAQDAAKPAKQTKAAKKCEDRFKAMDTNGDGFVTLDEFIGKCKKCDKAKKEAKFKAKDANGDGKLTLDEFCAKKPKAKKEKAAQ